MRIHRILFVMLMILAVLAVACGGGTDTPSDVVEEDNAVTAPELTETYSGDTWAFSYPTGWVIEEVDTIIFIYSLDF